jgi:hypothetical protein
MLAVETPAGLMAVPSLTPSFLRRNFIPLFEALNCINRALEAAQGRDAADISILFLRRRNPVEVNFKGTAKETLEFFRDELTPWRRKHAKREAELEERKRKAESEVAELGTAEARARLESVLIENEKARSELKRDELRDALKLATELNPNASVADKMRTALELRAALNSSLETELTLAPPARSLSEEPGPGG